MQSFGASKEFLKDEDFEWEVVGEGIKRKIMGYDDKIMMVNVLFEKGSIISLSYLKIYIKNKNKITKSNQP